ncbi:hypothetical protein [Clostridium sp. ATCC 25772]|uniref:hypothetical protein n=1 Tax=Clostridium sp. ATCC 25772 TaxID=1676991 RepID=UPI000781284C|nr:hypothetical protein [Clostridium sp. ATCC 25772]
MKYTGMDKQALNKDIDKARKYYENGKKYIYLFLIGIVISIIFFLLAINICTIKKQQNNHHFCIEMILATFSLNFPLVMIFFAYPYVKKYQQLKKYEKRINKDISVEIKENQVIYQENKIIKNVIKDIRDVQKNEDNYIKLMGDNQIILIDGYINNGKYLLDIFTFIKNVNLSKEFKNSSFKQLLKVTDFNKQIFYDEIKKMTFLLAINYTLENFTEYDNCITNDAGLTYKYETKIVKNRGKYICVYSENSEINTDYFNHSIMATYKEIFNIVVNTSVDIFNDSNILNGIVINPNSDNIILTLNEK